MKWLLFIVLFLCAPDILLGKPAGPIDGNGHSGDIVRVLGLDSKTELSKTITDSFANYIDNQQDAIRLLNNIKTINPSFTWSNYTHRIFFHWGFNSDPKKSKAINTCLDKCQASSDQCSKIWNIIIDEQKKRNSGMMKAVEDAVKKKTGKGYCILNHDQINAIASIIYDVHILGDYIEGTDSSQQAIQPLDSVVADIIRASRKLGSRDYKKINELKDELNKAQYDSCQPSAAAGAILSVLIKHIPPLLKSSPLIKSALY